MIIRIPLGNVLGPSFSFRLSLFEPDYCNVGKEILAKLSSGNDAELSYSKGREGIIGKSLMDLFSQVMPVSPDVALARWEIQDEFDWHRDICKKCFKADIRKQGL